MHEFDEGQPMAQLVEQVDALGRLVAQLRGQLRGHHLVASHGDGLDAIDVLETLRTVHRGVALIESAERTAVAACRSIPVETRPTWGAIGAAVGQAATNAWRRFKGGAGE